jgi:hypothetical protein
MSTLNVANISDGSDTVETGYAINGSAKVWLDLLQTSTTVRDSLNVTSVTDNGVGDFTVNFSSALNSSGYAYSGEIDSSGATSSHMIFRLAPTAAKLAGSCGVYSGYATTTVGFTKLEYVGLAFTVHGDLA